MKTTNIFEFWEQGNRELLTKNDLNREAIEGYIRKNTSSATRAFGFNMIFYNVFILTNIILTVLNFPGYWRNPVIRSFLIIQGMLSVAFLIYGVFLFIRYRETRKYQIKTWDLIVKQLRFYGTYNEIWMIMVACSTIFLIFNLGLWVDYTDGSYPINNKKIFIVINVVVFTFIYGVQKLGALYTSSRLRSYLLDLKSGFLNESRKIEKQKRWLSALFLILALIFTATFILGLLKFLDY